MPDNEAGVLEMILLQREQSQILEALCGCLGANQSERQAAFFLPGAEQWELAATGDLTNRSRAILSEIAPETLSLNLFSKDAPGGDAAVQEVIYATTGAFHARHLYSGIGEMTGMFVCFESSAGWDPARKEKLDSTCRLAVLAIEQRNLLEELKWQAEHDALTGLSTRTSFERQLRRKLGLEGLSLLCINLDRFRLVNGVLGHSFGNIVLKNIGQRFAASLPAGAPLARVGGDEFAALVDESQAERAADRMLASLTQPFSIDDNQVYIGASIGISSATTASTPESLQREAYVALYHAKQKAKGKWLHFQASMAAIPPERLEMEMCLRSALAKNEMHLYYQPQVELGSEAICGAEALLRWKPEGLGVISPAKFIPILEETGLIVEFGQWILREACRQGLAWRRQTGVQLRVAVNVSAVQFLKPGFIQDVEAVLQETGFPHEFLELELTESLFVGDFAQARGIFEELRRLGIQTAVDDFGVGQSSLAYLHELPFHRLKIDQSFVTSISDDDKTAPLVKNIIQLAAGLGMTTIAEGIERTDQLELLRALGCDEGQGYLFGKPLPADAFLALWLDHTARCTAKMKR